MRRQYFRAPRTRLKKMVSSPFSGDVFQGNLSARTHISESKRTSQCLSPVNNRKQVMKMTSKALLAAVLLLPIAAVPLRAQNSADTKAKDEPAVATKDEAVTNDAKGARESVRIDHTNVHVGSEDPVDITLPNFGASSGFLGPLLPIISVVMVFG